jgi:hypothetical protein
MTSEDVALGEPKQYPWGASQWLVTEPGPETVTISPAFGPSAHQLIIDAGAGWLWRGDQPLATESGSLLLARPIRSLGRTQGILGAPTRGPDLDVALADLAQATGEAREDGFDPPSDLALRNADQLLRAMYAHRPCRFEVYPTQDREVAIYILQRERSVLVLCSSDGSVRCSVNLNGKHCRAYYDPALVADLPGGFPDGFLREALAALDVA